MVSGEPVELVDLGKAKKTRFEKVLEALEVRGLQADGAKLVGRCPLPHAGERGECTFYVDVEKQVFKCYQCKKEGNVLEFAAARWGRGLIDAGKWLLSL